MRVIVNPDGEVSFETENTDQALTMIRALRNGSAPVGRKRKARPVESTPDEPDVKLSKTMTQTWEWLVACDTPKGASVTEMADGLGISHATANWRLNKLMRLGVVRRVRRGHYRAGEAE